MAMKLSFNAFSALAGGGIDVPLGSGFKVRPIVLAGYSHVGGDATFYGPNSVLARSQVSGILSDASLNSVLLGGALELIYETPLRGDMNLRAQVRYNELVALVTEASSSALQDSGTFGVANASVPSPARQAGTLPTTPCDGWATPRERGCRKPTPAYWGSTHTPSWAEDCRSSRRT